jgi:hypothetical protein
MKPAWCLLFGVLASPFASSDELKNFRVGGGYVETLVDAYGLDNERVDIGVAGLFGSISYQPLSWFGFEYRHSYRRDPNSYRLGDVLDLHTHDLMLNFHQRVARTLYISGKLGYSFWDAEGYTRHSSFIVSENSNQSGPWQLIDDGGRVRFEGDGQDPIVGLALTYAVKPNLELSWSLDHVESDYLELTTFRLGVFTRF